MLSSEMDPLPRRGDRVVLRRLRADDLQPFHAYRSSAEVGRYQGWTPMSVAEAESFLREMHSAAGFRPDEWFQVAIADPLTDRLIGDIGVCLRTEDAPVAEIGFTLDPGSQGKGLAAAAVREIVALLFQATAVARVIAITDARNQPSVRLLQRAGMLLDRSVESIFRGEPCIELVFVLRREQWLATQSPATANHGSQ
jgi:RimJ/RimL family protein N-acetyltransferase